MVSRIDARNTKIANLPIFIFCCMIEFFSFWVGLSPAYVLKQHLLFQLELLADL